MSKMGKMNLAIAGCGAIARDHLNALRGIDALNLVALCDIDEQSVRRMSRECNVSQCYTDFSEMLKKEHLSIVSILTPPQTHASMAIEAISHGINVLLEKPLTMTTSEAKLIWKLSEVVRSN